jgi:hypothetical protein
MSPATFTARRDELLFDDNYLGRRVGMVDVNHGLRFELSRSQKRVGSHKGLGITGWAFWPMPELRPDLQALAGV